MRAFGLAGFLCLLLLTACGGKNSDSTAHKTSPSPADSGAPDPCELLSDEFIRANFELGDAEISRRPDSHTRYSLCSISWPRQNAAELEAAYRTKMRDYGMAKARREEVEMPEPPRDNELALTIPNQRFDSPAQATAALDSGMDLLVRGTRLDRDDPDSPRILQHENEPVTDVGNKAAWVAGMNQLGVATDHRVFHIKVAVVDDPEANRAKAVELARLLLARID